MFKNVRHIAVTDSVNADFRKKVGGYSFSIFFLPPKSRKLSAKRYCTIDIFRRCDIIEKHRKIRKEKRNFRKGAADDSRRTDE